MSVLAIRRFRRVGEEMEMAMRVERCVRAEAQEALPSSRVQHFFSSAEVWRSSYARVRSCACGASRAQGRPVVADLHAECRHGRRDGDER